MLLYVYSLVHLYLVQLFPQSHHLLARVECHLRPKQRLLYLTLREQQAENNRTA